MTSESDMPNRTIADDASQVVDGGRRRRFARQVADAVACAPATQASVKSPHRPTGVERRNLLASEMDEILAKLP